MENYLLYKDLIQEQRYISTIDYIKPIMTNSEIIEYFNNLYESSRVASRKIEYRNFGRYYLKDLSKLELIELAKSHGIREDLTIEELVKSLTSISSNSRRSMSSWELRVLDGDVQSLKKRVIDLVKRTKPIPGDTELAEKLYNTDIYLIIENVSLETLAYIIILIINGLLITGLTKRCIQSSIYKSCRHRLGNKYDELCLKLYTIAKPTNE